MIGSGELERSRIPGNRTGNSETVDLARYFLSAPASHRAVGPCELDAVMLFLRTPSSSPGSVTCSLCSGVRSFCGRTLSEWAMRLARLVFP